MSSSFRMCGYLSSGRSYSFTVSKADVVFVPDHKEYPAAVPDVE